MLHPYLISHCATCSPPWECAHTHTHTHTHTHRGKTHKDILFPSSVLVSPAGEPSPPAVHGQRGMGKAYRLGLVKQDDGGMPIVEYIVKYKTVSIWEQFTVKHGYRGHFVCHSSCWVISKTCAFQVKMSAMSEKSERTLLLRHVMLLFCYVMLFCSHFTVDM